MKTAHFSEDWKAQLELYALGILQSERFHEMEEHLNTGCSRCSQELLEIQTALTILPESLPVAPLSAEVKSRILDGIHGRMNPDIPDRLAGFEDFPWIDTGLDGVSVHWLRQDNVTGTTVALLRVKPGAVFLNHKHVGSEDCFVLQGGFQDDRGTYHAGDYIHYEAGSTQTSLRALEGEDCILFLVNESGIEFVD